MWLSYRNWVDADATTISADSEASSDMAAANLASRLSYKNWRTDGLTASFYRAGVLFDFGVARQVQCLALVFPRINDPDVYDGAAAIGASDTIQHKLDLASAGSGAVYNSGALASGVDPGFGVHAVRLPAAVNARYWRVDISAPSRSSVGYLDLIRAWAGPIVEPRVGISYGASRLWQSDSILVKPSRSTSVLIESQESVRVWTMTLDWIADATEAEALDDFERTATTAAQFLIARPDLPTGRAVMLARQQQSTGLTAANYGTSAKTFRIIEDV